MSIRIHCLVVAPLLVTASASRADLYKCPGEDGVPVFQQVPCKDRKGVALKKEARSCSAIIKRIAKKGLGSVRMGDLDYQIRDACGDSLKCLLVKQHIATLMAQSLMAGKTPGKILMAGVVTAKDQCNTWKGRGDLVDCAKRASLIREMLLEQTDRRTAHEAMAMFYLQCVDKGAETAKTLLSD